MDRASPIRIHLALFTVAVLFTANYIISKLGMRELAPLSFAWLRVAGAALLMMVIARHEPRLSREDSWRVAGFAVLGVTINATLFLVGLSMTTVQVAAILITTIPVFVLATAIALGRERPTATRIGGIILACAGALLVVGGESLSGTARSVLGAVLIVINCLSFSVYLVVSKPAMARLSAKAVVARMFAVGSLLIFPVAAVPLARENWASISLGAWMALLTVILGPTVAAYLLNAWALRHADSSVVAAYTYVQPVLATILGAIIFGEEIRPIVVVAALMIFAGVALAGRATGPVPE
ncbi:MAG TPA: DMT family transporter [Thermoanaerobaculia bacterium]|nr:DMT family transporter [Thermoanaerobaculia bacterium]